MSLVPGIFSYNKKNGMIGWKFVLFLALCFILGILFIFLFFPEFFSGPIIKRIPIIIEDENGEVMAAILNEI